MYLLLHRAIRNAGDFLIFRRAKALIETYRPDVRTMVGKAWLPVTDQFAANDLKDCRAVIVCGGPGYQNDLHVALYPRIDELDGSLPVVFLALGTYLFPGRNDQISGFRFNAKTREFLKRIATEQVPLSARDDLTATVLRTNGFNSALMTGDPAWFDLEAIDRPMNAVTEVRSLAFTPPASPLFDAQAAEVMRRLDTRFSTARKLVVFHRGIQPRFERLARTMGWSLADISGSADGFALYDGVDVHVGYRLHAHLYSLSRGIATYLLAEDSRGFGALRTLGPLGVEAIAPSSAPIGLLRAAHRIAARIPGISSELSRPFGRAFGIDRTGPALALVDQIDADTAGSWARHEEARQQIRATLPTMRSYVQALP